MNSDDTTVSSLERQKQLLAELSEEQAKRKIAEARLDAILNSVVDGIVTIDIYGTVQSYNKAAEKLFGYPVNDVIGKNVTMLMPKDTQPQHEQGLKRYRLTRQPRILGSCVEVIAKNKSGKLIPVELTISRIDDGNDCLFTGIIRDITQRKEAEEKIRQMALHDPLTGLPNRNLFNVHLEQAIHRAKRNNTDMALMYLDLDNFKSVNDEHGHEAGDAVLQEISNRFGHAIRTTDLIARVGGDEFVAVLEVINGRDNASILARRLISAAGEAVHYIDNQYTIGVSIGIAIFPTHAESSEELIKAADKAMYAVKKGGRNRYLFFDDIQKQPSPPD